MQDATRQESRSSLALLMARPMNFVLQVCASPLFYFIFFLSNDDGIWQAGQHLY
jgi:hypothetical protein